MSNILKRGLALLLTLCMGVTLLAGCGEGATSSTDTGSQGGNVSEPDDTADTTSDTTEGTESGTEADASQTNSENEQQTANNSTGKTSSSKTNATDKASSQSGSAQNTSKKLIIYDDQKNTTLTRAIVEYQKQHKDVEIELKQGDAGGKTTLQGLKLDSRSKNAADIVCMDQVYLVAAGNSGYLLDLNKYGFSSIKGQFVEACVNSITYQNKTYGMPFDANTVCMVYNKTLLNEANADVPTNYTELTETANKMKAKFGNSKYAYTTPFAGWTDKNWVAFNYFFWLWRMGGEILSDDLKTSTFNSEEGVKALQMMVDMKNNGQASPKYQHDEFKSGQVGIIDIGSWAYDELFGANKKAEFGVALMPTLKNGVPGYSGLGLYCYGITSSCKNPELAYDFLKFYCASKDYQLQYCKQNNFIPSLTVAHSDSFYSKEIWQTMIAQLKLSKARPGVPNWETMETTIAGAVEAAASGKSPKEVLDAAAKTIDRLLARQ